MHAEEERLTGSNVDTMIKVEISEFNGWFFDMFRTASN